MIVEMLENSIIRSECAHLVIEEELRILLSTACAYDATRSKPSEHLVAEVEK